MIPDAIIEKAARAVFDYQYPAWHYASPEGEACRSYARAVLEAVLPDIAKARDQLFKLGDFTMHSGALGHWKIACDALADADIDCLAFMLNDIVPPFGSVEGVPSGGIRIADAMQKYVTTGPLLIVDDVFTTGTSMHTQRAGRLGANGAVLFARNPCPTWITPLLTVRPSLFSDSAG